MNRRERVLVEQGCVMKHGRPWVGWLVLLMALGLASGCHTLAQRPLMTLGDVVRMSQDGTSPSAIIASLEQHRVQLEFTGSQFAKLKDQGVADEVLDYLLNAYADRIRYETRLQSEPLWWHHSYYWSPRVIVVDRPKR
jgi:hypothetical protein